jgi:hypothetical protein
VKIKVEATHDISDVNVLQFRTVVDESSDGLAELLLVLFIQTDGIGYAVSNFQDVQVRTALPDLLEQLSGTKRKKEVPGKS